MSGVDPVYVAARRVLLDALQALSAHRDALVVCGAQAVYLQTGGNHLAVAPYTTDGDVAIDPAQLREDPLLESAMGEAGFQLALYDGHVEPGIWHARTTVEDNEIVVPVDLIVPEGAATGGGRRGARLGVHGPRAARRALGLDAADVVRIMQTTRPASVGVTMASLTGHPIAGAVSTAAIWPADYLGESDRSLVRHMLDDLVRARDAFAEGRTRPRRHHGADGGGAEGQR